MNYRMVTAMAKHIMGMDWIKNESITLNDIRVIIMSAYFMDHGVKKYRPVGINKLSFRDIGLFESILDVAKHMHMMINGNWVIPMDCINAMMDGGGNNV